jgi:hypothetical protein
VAIKHLLVLDHSGKEIYQTNVYLHGLYYMLSHVHTAAKLTISWGSLQDEYLLSLPLSSDALLGKNTVGQMDNPIVVTIQMHILEEVMRI